MSEPTPKNYYVKTSTAKFYLRDVKLVTRLQDEYCFYKTDDSIILCVPDLELEYYFTCNENKYNTLSTDLKRGVIHL